VATLPATLYGQTCLGLSPESNTPEVVLGAYAQNEGTRIGGRGQATIGRTLGLQFGGSVGAIDGDVDDGYELAGLVAWNLGDPASGRCAFGEFEITGASFQNTRGQTRGDYWEHWTRFGYAVAAELVRVGDLSVSGHVAPEAIWRVTNLSGRKIYAEPEVHVLETRKRETAFHLGGRVLLTARMNRVHILFGLKTRPRIESDRLWTLGLGFAI
jgi:hypothetical protein